MGGGRRRGRGRRRGLEVAVEGQEFLSDRFVIEVVDGALFGLVVPAADEGEVAGGGFGHEGGEEGFE